VPGIIFPQVIGLLTVIDVLVEVISFVVIVAKLTPVMEEQLTVPQVIVFPVAVRSLLIVMEDAPLEENVFANTSLHDNPPVYPIALDVSVPLGLDCVITKFPQNTIPSPAFTFPLFVVSTPLIETSPLHIIPFPDIVL
jgi:hypothetical protein